MEEEIAYIGDRRTWGGEVPFGISSVDRRQHLYIAGKTGTGKDDPASKPHLPRHLAGKGVGVIDPHGDLAEELLDCIPSWRLHDVVYFDPADAEFLSPSIFFVRSRKSGHIWTHQASSEHSSICGVTHGAALGIYFVRRRCGSHGMRRRFTPRIPECLQMKNTDGGWSGKSRPMWVLLGE